MATRVNIINGELIIGKRAFPLDSQDVDVSGFNYSGLACLQGGKMRIIIGRSTIYDFSIGEATQESLDYEAGYNHGSTQKRKRTPQNKPSDFYYGWLSAWQEKRGA